LDDTGENNWSRPGLAVKEILKCLSDVVLNNVFTTTVEIVLDFFTRGLEQIS
jgi:hypothetical protein